MRRTPKKAVDPSPAAARPRDPRPPGRAPGRAAPSPRQVQHTDSAAIRVLHRHQLHCNQGECIVQQLQQQRSRWDELYFKQRAIMTSITDRLQKQRYSSASRIHPYFRRCDRPAMIGEGARMRFRRCNRILKFVSRTEHKLQLKAR